MASTYGEKALWAALDALSERRKRQHLDNPMGLLHRMLADGVSEPAPRKSITFESPEAYATRMALEKKYLQENQVPPEERRQWIAECRRRIKRQSALGKGGGDAAQRTAQ